MTNAEAAKAYALERYGFEIEAVEDVTLALDCVGYVAIGDRRSGVGCMVAPTTLDHWKYCVDELFEQPPLPIGLDPNIYKAIAYGREKYPRWRLWYEEPVGLCIYCAGSMIAESFDGRRRGAFDPSCMVFLTLEDWKRAVDRAVDRALADEEP